ncbi:hypothetical protein [Acetohalobium arabaticum]|nr:hypothetical protein [Acetohalobium arabaticum]
MKLGISMPSSSLMNQISGEIQRYKEWKKKDNKVSEDEVIDIE